MPARGVVRITAADIGRRVTVRYLTHAPAGDPSFADVVGYLRRWEHGVLTIERRDGRLAQVPEAALVAAKVVPTP